MLECIIAPLSPQFAGLTHVCMNNRQSCQKVNDIILCHNSQKKRQKSGLCLMMHVQVSNSHPLKVW
jgi:hypothetical protein